MHGSTCETDDSLVAYAEGLRTKNSDNNLVVFFESAVDVKFVEAAKAFGQSVSVQRFFG